MGFGRAAAVFTGDSGKTVSVWMSSPGPPEPGSIEKDLATDVCVVGGGMAGLTTAYLLAREGRSVVLLDDGPLTGGETCRTTAHLSNALDDRYAHLEKVRGEDGARLAAESHTAAVDRIEKIIGDERISCGFERLDGYLFNPRDDRQENLPEERDAARRAGLAGVELLDRAPLPSFDTGPCLRFPRQAQFHPLRYLGALARAIARDGGRLFTGSHVDSVEGGDSPRVVTSRGPVVTARSVVVATNSPIHTGLAIHAKQAPYRTYAIAGAVPRGAVPRALYWDTGSPYHYVRLHSDDGEELLIVGGEDHKTGQEERPQERLARLETWARERFPEMGPIAYRWSGQVMETLDGLAFIGPSPDGGQNVYVATGDSGMGMTHGTIAGILLTDRIGGRESPWAELYDPSRKPLRAVGEVLRENLNVALQYADRAAPADVGDVSEVPRGAGAVLRRGARQIAVYRGSDGTLHEMSAVCPHMGCVVSWNSLESSWDCPCHGSRFDSQGRVINGPAAGDLPPADG